MPRRIDKITRKMVLGYPAELRAAYPADPYSGEAPAESHHMLVEKLKKEVLRLPQHELVGIILAMPESFREQSRGEVIWCFTKEEMERADVPIGQRMLSGLAICALDEHLRNYVQQLR